MEFLGKPRLEVESVYPIKGRGRVSDISKGVFAGVVTLSLQDSLSAGRAILIGS